MRCPFTIVPSVVFLNLVKISKRRYDLYRMSYSNKYNTEFKTNLLKENVKVNLLSYFISKTELYSLRTLNEKINRIRSISLSIQLGFTLN